MKSTQLKIRFKSKKKTSSIILICFSVTGNNNVSIIHIIFISVVITVNYSPPLCTLDIDVK